VIAIIGILAGLLLPVLAKAKMKAQRVQCLSDLKQMGVGFHTFLHDHNSLLPMQVSTNDGGTLEYIYASYRIAGEFYFQYRHFQSLSNELFTPKIVYCPSDRDRLMGENFHDFSDLNVSYFVGANADYSLPNSMLAGDRNVTNVANGGPTIFRLNSFAGAYWTGDLHQFKGNILFADGRAEEVNSTGLTVAGFGAPDVMDLIVPSVKFTNSVATASYSPPYSPPGNLPSAPTPVARPAGYTPNTSYRSPSTAPITPAVSSSAAPRSPSSPEYIASAAPRMNAPRAVSSPDDSTSGTKSTKVMKAPPAVHTNEAKITNEPPAVLAETVAKPVHHSSHWPWWLLLFLVIAGEALRRRYLYVQRERARRRNAR
jgi:prepilin-type processing-associated H-X9-DG protein